MTELGLEETEVVVCKVVPVLELDTPRDDEPCDDVEAAEGAVCVEKLADAEAERDEDAGEAEDNVWIIELTETEDEDDADELLGCIDELAGVEEDKDVIEEEAVVYEDEVAVEEEERLRLPDPITALEVTTLDGPADDIDCGADEDPTEGDADADRDVPTTEDVRREEEGLEDKELPDVP